LLAKFLNVWRLPQTARINFVILITVAHLQCGLITLPPQRLIASYDGGCGSRYHAPSNTVDSVF